MAEGILFIENEVAFFENLALDANSSRRCCCSGCLFCYGPTPNEISVTFGGINNNECTNCSFFNKTFLLSLNRAESSDVQCTYIQTGLFPCSGGTIPYRIDVTFEGGQVGAGILINGFPDGRWTIPSGLACTGTWNMTNISITTVKCDSTAGATAIINI